MTNSTDNVALDLNDTDCDDACVNNHAPDVGTDDVATPTLDEQVTVCEVPFLRETLESVHDRRQNNAPKKSPNETQGDFEVRHGWWKRAQGVLEAAEDVADTELVMRLAKGLILYCNYNEANNLMRAVMANMTYRFRSQERGIVTRQAKALQDATRGSGDSLVADVVDALFAEEADAANEPYAGTTNEYMDNLNPDVIRYIAESIHDMFSRVLARMWTRDNDAARKNNTPTPFQFEALPFTSVQKGKEFIPQITLDDAMKALDVLESERAINASTLLSAASEIVL
jgi:hypothetical protein